MELIKLSCANCGGTLEIGLQADMITCAYCGVQLQVRRSASACWSELQSRLDQQSTSIELLSLQQGLAQCDSDWLVNREQYLLRGDEPKEEHHVIGRAVTAVLTVVGVALLLIWALTPVSPPFDPGFPFVFETRSTGSSQVQVERNIKRDAVDSWERFAAGCLFGGPVFLAGAFVTALVNVNTKVRWEAFQKAVSEHQHKRAAILEQIDGLTTRTHQL